MCVPDALQSLKLAPIARASTPRPRRRDISYQRTASPNPPLPLHATGSVILAPSDVSWWTVAFRAVPTTLAAATAVIAPIGMGTG